jgi:shikimate dehydrogenase
MKTFGLIGYPLSHSFSKKFFDKKIATENIADTEFKLFPLPTISAVEMLLKTEPDLKGFAITIPYKKEIIPFLDIVSGEVEKTGACNCVKIEKGKLSGYNTDIIGFERSFTKHLQPHHTKALVLGTGGAAAAVEFVLRKLNIQFTNVSRKPFANQLTYDDLNEKLLQSFTIIINTTPLGTFPEVDEAPAVPFQFISSKHYCFDLVYNPSVTKFLQLAGTKGATTQNGYEMLELQAEENWRIWNSQFENESG